MRKRSDARWTGVRVEGFNVVHGVEFSPPPGSAPAPLCNISTGSRAFKLTMNEVTCLRCSRLQNKPILTPLQKAYLQGWRHGTKDEQKQGPANQKNLKLRAAYLQGFEHGVSDLENAEAHGEQNYV